MYFLFHHEQTFWPVSDSPTVRMAERSKALRSVAVWFSRRGFESHF